MYGNMELGWLHTTNALPASMLMMNPVQFHTLHAYYHFIAMDKIEKIFPRFEVHLIIHPGSIAFTSPVSTGQFIKTSCNGHKTELSLCRQTNEDTSSARGVDVLVRRATSFYVQPQRPGWTNRDDGMELAALHYNIYYETIIELYLLLLLQVNVMREFYMSIEQPLIIWMMLLPGGEPIPCRVRVLLFTRERPDHFCVTWIS